MKVKKRTFKPEAFRALRGLWGEEMVLEFSSWDYDKDEETLYRVYVDQYDLLGIARATRAKLAEHREDLNRRFAEVFRV